jgi:hypothetical protein
MKRISTLSDEGISSLINLQTLSLNAVSGITDNGIKELYNLKSLSLEGIDTIGDISMKSLTNLTELSITGECSKITNHGLNYLKDSLQSFALWNNSIITDGIGELTNLTELFVCLAYTSNESLKKLTNLTYLSFENNGKIDINGIRGLTNLIDLSISEKGLFSYDELVEVFPKTKIYLS